MNYKVGKVVLFLIFCTQHMIDVIHTLVYQILNIR